MRREAASAADVDVTVTTTQPIMAPTHLTGVDSYMNGLVKFAQAVVPGSARVIARVGDDRNALDDAAVNDYLDDIVARTGAVEIVFNAVGPLVKEYGNGTHAVDLTTAHVPVDIATSQTAILDVLSPTDDEDRQPPFTDASRVAAHGSTRQAVHVGPDCQDARYESGRGAADDGGTETSRVRPLREGARRGMVACA
jgi:hypothetical protein